MESHRINTHGQHPELMQLPTISQFKQLFH